MCPANIQPAKLTWRYLAYPLPAPGPRKPSTNDLLHGIKLHAPLAHRASHPRSPGARARRLRSVLSPQTPTLPYILTHPRSRKLVRHRLRLALRDQLPDCRLHLDALRRPHLPNRLPEIPAPALPPLCHLGRRDRHHGLLAVGLSQHGRFHEPPRFLPGRSVYEREGRRGVCSV